jgi:lysophospholipase L1-like esterase
MRGNNLGGWIWTRGRRSQPQGGRRPTLELEVLEDRTLPTATVPIGAMGDSLTAPYAGTGHGSAGDRCWVEQFQALRSQDDIQIYNLAHGGATTTTLLQQGQPNAVADLVAAGEVRYAVLIIGANDESQFLGSIFQGNPAPFVNTVVPNIEHALSIVAGGGDVSLVLGNLPDIGVTPLFRSTVTNDPVLLQRLTDAVTMANQQLQGWADANQVPVVDLFSLSYLTLAPITIGDVEIDNAFAPDGFHPNTIAQGILGNTILAAMNVAYGEDVSALSLSDQEILTEAGIDFPPELTYFDVSPYVLYNGGSNLARQSQAELAGAFASHTISPLGRPDVQIDRAEQAAVRVFSPDQTTDVARGSTAQIISDPGTGLSEKPQAMPTLNLAEITGAGEIAALDLRS